MIPFPVGMVIEVFRGGCQVFAEDSIHELRLVGRHALHGVELAVGDDVSFDPDRGVVVDVQPRRTRLARRRPRDDPRQEHVIAANMDRLAVVVCEGTPRFRSRGVDRFALGGIAGGLEVLLIVNKVDLLQGEPLSAEISAYSSFLPVLPVSARCGTGIDALRARLADSRTVLAGSSGVGKSALLNALQPELELRTRPVSRVAKGRHTTTRSTLYRLPGNALVVDTPGLREYAAGPLPVELLDQVFPDVALLAGDCRFRDCRHAVEPDCAVQAAIAGGSLKPGRLASYCRLREEALSTAH